MRWLPIAALLAAVAAPQVAHADGLEARVLVVPPEPTGKLPKPLANLPAEVAAALTRAASSTGAVVARAEASLEDTAVIVGCDPHDDACLADVAAALNVDEILHGEIVADDQTVTVTLTLVTRDSAPVTRTYKLDRNNVDAGLAQLEVDSAEMFRIVAPDRGEHKPPPPPLPPAPPPPVEVTHEAGFSLGRASTPAWIVTGGGAVALVAGAVFWSMASSTQGDIDAAPTATAADLKHLVELEDKASSQALLGNVLGIGGGVAVAVGVSWVIWSASQGPAERVTITPMIGGDKVGVALTVLGP